MIKYEPLEESLTAKQCQPGYVYELVDSGRPVMFFCTEDTGYQVLDKYGVPLIEMHPGIYLDTGMMDGFGQAPRFIRRGFMKGSQWDS